MFVADLATRDTSTTITYLYKQVQEESSTIPFTNYASVAHTINCAGTALRLVGESLNLTERMAVP